MKIVEKTKVKKQKTKKKPAVKTKKQNVLIVAQEIKFARFLSSNEKKTRDRALKSLKKWLLNCFTQGYEFKDSDFKRIWKGLFYAVWISDKPLVQEELCENISSILDLFPDEYLGSALLMVKTGWRALATEWYGIDQHRMDKCLMLVRRYLRGSLRCLRRSGWSADSCRQYADMMGGDDGILAVTTPLYARNAVSMTLHIIDCFLEELAKVSQGDIPASSVSELLRPFCAYMCYGQACVVCAASRRVLNALVRQSALGLSYGERTRAWEQMGCPAGGPDALELVSDDEGGDADGDASDDDTGSSEAVLDPRAGRVDVILPLLPVPCNEIVAMLTEMVANVGSKAHKRARLCLQRFQQLSEDQYPLPVTELALESGKRVPPSRAARSLQALEKRLAASSDELALRGLSRKHRKRLLAKSRSGHSIVEDVERINSANGDWQVEVTEPEAKKKKRDHSDKENVQKSEKRKLTQQNGDFSPKKVSETPKNELNKHDNKLTEHKSKKNKKFKEKTDEKQLNGIGKADKVASVIVNKISNKDLSKVKGNKTHLNTNEMKSRKSKNEVKKSGNKTVVLNRMNYQKQLSPKSKSDNEISSSKSKNGVRKSTNEVWKSENGVRKSKNEVVKVKNPTVIVNKVKMFQKQLSPKSCDNTPKKVKFVLQNNCMQAPVDYYKSVRQSPNIPFDSSKIPVKTNLKPSTPSPINPFFKKKLRMK